MTLPTISATRAAEMLRAGDALLVDVREADERARSHVPGTAHLPLSRLDDARRPGPPGGAVIFHCATGARTAQHAARLAAHAGDGGAFIVAGGIDALRRAGVAVADNRSAPLPLMRQVQIAAGSLVLAGVLLGTLVAPAFYGLAGFVGAGLVFAGTTGFCGMANILAAMPWNRRTA
ncbi:rhodanese family protein [Roseomonas sp. CECT 9278]|uniref:rhodanese-like domain-containing protein n=1 Tax=Roseomonas sp. CECT 9278 TaxID=2845823 RepID=UPI001E385D03|nr:rhodanese family protein [Roseomonas sp. CECT 9278]CAH0294571.1 Inner membrane protein YgaP [Roseomonas sp. CECT 9278]